MRKCIFSLWLLIATKLFPPEYSSFHLNVKLIGYSDSFHLLPPQQLYWGSDDFINESQQKQRNKHKRKDSSAHRTPTILCSFSLLYWFVMKSEKRITLVTYSLELNPLATVKNMGLRFGVGSRSCPYYRDVMKKKNEVKGPSIAEPFNIEFGVDRREDKHINKVITRA